MGRKYPRELYQSRIYRTWGDMKTRCLNINHKQYPDYGGRGIRICARWLDFKNFYDDMHSTYKDDLTLDRINNDGDYKPSNCRWATKIQQQNNTRSNRRVTFNGVTMTVAQWAKRSGLKSSTFEQRFYTYKWGIERCLLPLQRKRG